jgi:hypothetical protein
MSRLSRLKLTSRSPGITSQVSGGGGGLLKTRQTTAYHVGDDGDYEAGLPASYTVMTTGQFSGTTALDVAHYAAATLTFAAADDSITDAAAGLVTFLDTDTIRIRGSALNDGVYTVSVGTGATAGHFHVDQPLADEAAGAYITICKQSAPSNNCVVDNVTGLMWKRDTSSLEKVGPVSDGKICFYDATRCFALHAAGADLQMIASPKTLRIVGGAGEVARYFAGMTIVCAGFVNAVNNLPGHVVTAVTVNGADLDLSLWTGNITLAAEAAGGARTIKVVCQSIYSYAAAHNVASYAGYTDWRVANMTELLSLCDMEAPTAMPNAVAFPNWSVADYYHASTISPPVAATSNTNVKFNSPVVTSSAKATNLFCALVRG